MAYPDNWTTYKANSSMAVALDPINTLDGSSSLRMTRNGTVGRYANCVRNGPPMGFSSGTARGLLWQLTRTYQDWWGFAFQQSREDLSNGLGEAYGAGVCWENTVASGQFQLVKFTAGLGARTILTYGEQIDVVGTDVYCFEVAWVLDIEALGGLYVTMKHGVSFDFSDLALDFDYLIDTSVLTTSAGEGPCMALASTSSTGDYLFDRLKCDPYVLG